MSARLTKGMFGHEFGRPGEASSLFGLRCGQIRSKDYVHNGGWYNRQGEKLGWGDLSLDDLQRIEQQLEEGELFIILYEADSFRAFVRSPGIIGSRSVVNPDIEAPGVQFVAERCCIIIAHGRLCYVDRYGEQREKSFACDGVRFEVLAPEEAKQFIAS